MQEIIEARVEKRTKDTYVPMGGTKMLTFMDDFNMPAKDSFGSQPPLELIRQWIDYGFWYDRSKQTIRRINGMHLLVAMGPPGGGRTVISKRLQSRFNQLVITFPTVSCCRWGHEKLLVMMAWYPRVCDRDHFLKSFSTGAISMSWLYFDLRYF